VIRHVCCGQILRRHAQAFTVRSGIFIDERKTETLYIATWCNKFRVLGTFIFCTELFEFLSIIWFVWGPVMFLEINDCNQSGWLTWMGIFMGFPRPPVCRMCQISGKALIYIPAVHGLD
jgi:hypothetical protein